VAVGLDGDVRGGMYRRIERGLEGAADLEAHARSGLRLPQSNSIAVIGRPWEPQQVALPLSCPQRKQQWQMQMYWRRTQECSLIVGRPNLINPAPAINPAAAFAWVDRDLAAILRPGQNAR